MALKFIGTGPILMHSDRLVNRFDPLAKKFSAISGKRKKTDDDHEQLARIEWEGGLYLDDTVGPFLPGRMIKSALVGAAKKTKDGPKVKSGVLIMTDKAPLEYDGPRTIEKLWKDGRFADARSVVVQRSRIMRCRPIFNGWSAAFEVVFDPAVIDRADIVRISETCGALVGIGDYRPENGGDFGRFSVEVLK
jgi:hypothetical protein